VLHAEKDKDPSLNHLLMAHKHPEVAAQHMDICKSLLTTLYLLHKKMVGEVTHMLEEFTNSERVQTRMQKLSFVVAREYRYELPSVVARDQFMIWSVIFV
jgi:hypothetical protein